MSEATEVVVTEPTQAELDLATAVKLIGDKAKDGTSDDDLKILLMTDGGFPFAKAGRLFNKAMETLGIRMSAKDRYELVAELLMETDFAPKTWSEVEQAIEYVAEQVDSTDEKQAAVAVRRFAKDNGIELPKKPKTAHGARVTFKDVVFAYLAIHKGITGDEFRVWLREQSSRKEILNHYDSFADAVIMINEKWNEA